MRPIEQALMLSMILIVAVILGYAIVRPAPRPTSQPDGAPSEYPSPFVGSFPGRETSVSLANGIAAEVWIGASEASFAVKAGQVALSPSPAATGAPPAPAPTSRRKETPIAKPAHRFTPGGRVFSRAVSGQATWYRYRVGQAAAGPRLRAAIGPRWRGTVVSVSTATRTIRVRLTDWCLCGAARVIDLDAGSFAALGPLSRGVLRVRVSW